MLFYKWNVKESNPLPFWTSFIFVVSKNKPDDFYKIMILIIVIMMMIIIIVVCQSLMTMTAS